jgi:TetR/AcrR family transcriptional repressor of nem operon
MVPTSWYVSHMPTVWPRKKSRQANPPLVRSRLLGAAHSLMRRRGYSATSVDDLCAAAGVTKGAFFHHFASKEALAVAAAHSWSDHADALFGAAPYHQLQDPLARVLGYIDFRAGLIDGPIENFSCFAGTVTQEVWSTSEAARAACGGSIAHHALGLAADIQAAIDRHGIRDGVTAMSLALHTQAVLQGAFVLAKAVDGAASARDTIAHLKRYVSMLFNHNP